jgi:hypothetical protein
MCIFIPALFTFAWLLGAVIFDCVCGFGVWAECLQFTFTICWELSANLSEIIRNFWELSANYWVFRFNFWVFRFNFWVSGKLINGNLQRVGVRGIPTHFSSFRYIACWVASMHGAIGFRL